MGGGWETSGGRGRGYRVPTSKKGREERTGDEKREGKVGEGKGQQRWGDLAPKVLRGDRRPCPYGCDILMETATTFQIQIPLMSRSVVCSKTYHFSGSAHPYS